jgi:NTE family protein
MKQPHRTFMPLHPPTGLQVRRQWWPALPSCLGALVSSLLALSCALVPAASEAADGRPKICLVLSGGGARGAAHIGVIKVLEELHVPIDCITGTSMGSIVGGAYAGGMTIDEMTAAVSKISTTDLFKEKLPRDQQEIRRKQDDRSILYGVEIGLAGSEIRLPKGVVTGVQLETVLRGLVKTKGFRHFDQLPIPYRAVATDLVTGKPVVFSEGELANVMRASMSVPGAIAPAELEGKLLVDGGLTNNLPVDVARAMGADIVIAVNLGTPLMKREELNSVLGVTGQMINILTEQNVRASLASLKPTDILIEPALGDFSAADFDHLLKTIPIGEAAARAATDRLSRLSVSPAEFADLHATRLAASTTTEDRQPIDEIRFKPMERVNPEALRHLVKTKEGEPIDQKVLDTDMLRIFGTGDFEHVNYRILEEAGRHVLMIDAAEKAWGPNYLRFGLGLGSDLAGDSFFNLAASYRRTWVNDRGAEWRTDGQIGRNTHLQTEFYQPFVAGGTWFVAPRALIERRSEDVFQGTDRIARYLIRTTQGEIDLGANLSPYGEARLGYVAGRVKPRLETGPQVLQPPEASIKQGALVARGIVDQLDSANFPRYGYAADATVFASRQALGATDNYTKAETNLTASYSLGRHTLTVGGKAGGAIGGGDLPLYDLEQWGGFLQQSGYPFGALLGQKLLYGRLVYSNRLVEQTLFEGLYAGISLEAGRMENPLVPGSPTGLLKSSAIFLGYDSPLGPLYLGYGFAADGSRSAYLYLGRP